MSTNAAQHFRPLTRPHLQVEGDAAKEKLSARLEERGVGTLYSGAVDCAHKMLSIEGPQAFYKGVTAHFVRVGPHVVLTFVFINSMKRLVGTA